MYIVQLIIVNNGIVIFNTLIDECKTHRDVKRKAMKSIIDKMRDYYGIEGYYTHIIKAMQRKVCNNCLNANCDGKTCFPYYMIKYESYPGHELYGAPINDKEVEHWFMSTSYVTVNPSCIGNVSVSMI